VFGAQSVMVEDNAATADESDDESSKQSLEPK